MSRHRILGASRARWLHLLGLLPCLAVCAPDSVVAQGFGPDPFRPYNSQYDPFVYPVLPGPNDAGANPALQIQPGSRGANQFQNYLEGLGNGRGMASRHDRANRPYDKAFDREYVPNRKADESFDRSQEQVSDRYFEYLRARDPKEKAQLLRKYNQARDRASRELGSQRLTTRGTSTRSGAKSGNARSSSGARTGAYRDRLYPPAPLATDRPAPSARGRGGIPPSPAPASSAPAVSDDARSTTAPASPGAGRKPSDVLERSRRMDGEKKRGSGAIPPPPPPTP